MIKLENLEVSGWRAALRGMRNPKDSWSKADSIITTDIDGFQICKIGENDLKLAKSLHMGGPVHSKYKRYIIVTLDITAPLYWWKEFDTYKVGTVANSCSTMHKITSYPFTRDMFSHEHLTEESLEVLDKTIEVLNKMRDKYIKMNNTENVDATELKEVWWQLIQLLPSTFNQKRTVLLNYEVLTGLYRWRYNHKQDEWKQFCKFVLDLPYANNIILPPEMIKQENP